MPFFCYIVECADGSYYTGWTKDPPRREKQHNQGKGARYTRQHKPVKLVYIEEQPDLSTAIRRERKIKTLTREKKKVLIEQGNDIPKGQEKMMETKTNTKSNSDKDQLIVIAPGRVNLLGEHVDYNGGVVLPAAIDRTVRIVAEPRPGRVISLEAQDIGQSTEFDMDMVSKKVNTKGDPLPSWALYPAGVAWVLQKHGYELQGFSAVYSSDIPIGAGLSSSAAVEVAFAFLWQGLGGWEMGRMEIAQLCQEAENQYIGVNCGLMDQFAVANGVADHVMAFDTRSLKWKPVPLPPNTVIVIADSGVRRKLVGSAYNDRRRACEEAVRILRQYLPGVSTLRDVSQKEFHRFSSFLPDEVRMRSEYIIGEIARVESALDVLKAGDAAGFGQLMFATHQALRDLYEVSCAELDTLVEIAKRLDGCYGARLTGAGFGGCTVNLVRDDFAPKFIEDIGSRYLLESGRSAQVYLCKASQGVKFG